MSERADVERYRGYVESIVQRFASDTRVLWWEIYNEPAMSSSWSVSMRDAAFAWAQALQPAAPVISCWGDNPDTEIVDHHEYDTNYATGWAPQIFHNASKGGLITEGGSRWYQPPFSEDAGSVLTAVNFLEAVKASRQHRSDNDNDDNSSLPFSPSLPYPFVPGAMLSWEAFVGNSNTRWHWSSAAGSAEPAIPWDAWLFPDGTPISHTEAAALRRYVTGKDEFLSFNNFLPLDVVDGDAVLTVPPGTAWVAPQSAGVTALGDVLAEASVWLERGGSVRFVLRAGAVPSPSPSAATGGGGGGGASTITTSASNVPFITRASAATWPSSSSSGSSGSSSNSSWKRAAWEARLLKAGEPSESTPSSSLPVLLDASSLSSSASSPSSSASSSSYSSFSSSYASDYSYSLAPNCTLGALLNNTDVCPGGPPGYRDLSVANATDPLAACAAACCAWDECTAWIVREFEGTDHNCTDELCCWLKPSCTDTAPLPGATAAFVIQPPGPPALDTIAGYHVVVASSAEGDGGGGGDTLEVYRVNHTAAGSGDTSAAAAAAAAGPVPAPLLLGSFNLSTLENGLVLGAWNMLRVVVEDQQETTADGANASMSTRIRVFFNPMFPETGFVGNATADAWRVPLPLPPRIDVVDRSGPPLPPGGMAISAGNLQARVDYASALPASVF
jgi:hypothetical protein